MHFWLRTLFLITIFGLTKAHVRLIILAVLGLAGLWMVHTLAQDYQNISQNWNAGSVIKRLLSKRSINNENSDDYKDEKLPEVNWQNVLSKDPASCALSFVCQLAAHKYSSLEEEEQKILLLARHSHHKENWATKQLQKAVKLGEESSNPVHCRNVYILCPYSNKTMLKLLRLFGGT